MTSKANLKSRGKWKQFPIEAVRTYGAGDFKNNQTPGDMDDKKIMKIEECTTVEHSLEVINSDKLIKLFTSSTHCFIIIIEIDREGISPALDFAPRFPADKFPNRILIIQLNISQTKSSVIFSNEYNNELKVIEMENVTFDEECLLTASNLHFDECLKLLSLCIGGKFNGEDITTSEINKETFNSLKLTRNATCAGTPLAVTFLKLFDDKTDMETLETAVKFSVAEVVSALLDLPINRHLSYKAASQIQSTIDIEKMICLSAEHGEARTLKLFVELAPEELKSNLQKASDLAWREKKWENVKVLVENDFKFPQDIREVLESSDHDAILELKELCLARESFHEALQNSDKRIVENFICDNRSIKIGYSLDNKAALSVSLRSSQRNKNFEMYSLLSLNHFTAPNDTLHYNRYLALSDVDKNSIAQECSKLYGKPLKAHILFILSKTRLAQKYDDNKEKEYFEEIEGYLNEMNDVKEIVPMMKVMEYSKLSSIVFDFKNDSISECDPLSDKSAAGATNYKAGIIFIAAKASRNETLGTLIHEITHYALQTLFENNCKPYDANDNVTRIKFKKIVEEYKLWPESDHNSIVRKVFYTRYKPDVFAAELIVRVPQMMVQNRNSGRCLEADREKYKKLFGFYNELVERIGKPSAFARLREIQQVNDQLGHYTQLKALANEKTVEVDSSNSYTIKLVVSEVTKLAFGSIYTSLKNYLEKERIVKGTCIVASVSDFGNTYYREVFETIASTPTVSTFVIRFKFVETEESATNFFRFTSKRGINARYLIACNKIQANFIKENYKTLTHEIVVEEINHNWDCLFDETKNKFMESKILFQGMSINLTQILTSSSPALKYLPMKNLHSPLEFTVGTPIAKGAEFDAPLIVDRHFIQQDKNTTNSKSYERCLTNKTADLNTEILTIDEVITITSAKRFIVIADDPGKGKSFILAHLAFKCKEKLPEYLVVRVELRKHADKFNHIDANVQTFLFKHFIQCENDFERALFIDLFENKKIILLLDGVDEIASHFKDQFFGFLEKLKISPISQIWLSTKPQYCIGLKQKFDACVFSLKPFDNKDQIECIVRYWNKELPAASKRDLAIYASNLLAKINTAFGTTNTFAVPLHTHMLAEIFQENVERFLSTDNLLNNSFNVDISDKFSFYSTFVEKKRTLFQSRTDEVAIRTRISIEDARITLIQTHEMLSLKEIFGRTMESNWRTLPANALQCYALIGFDDGEPFFLHRNLAEYFAANYVIKKLPQIDDDIMQKIIFDPLNHRMIIDFMEGSTNSTIFFSDISLHKALAKVIGTRVALNSSNDLCFLHRLIYGNQIAMLELLLDSIKHCSNETIRAILSQKDEDGHNIFMLASVSGLKLIVRAIWDLVMRANRLPGRTKYFLEVGADGLNTFQIIYLSSHSECTMLEILVEIAHDALSSEGRASLITSCGYRQTLNDYNFLLLTKEHFLKSINIKWQIAQQLAQQPDEVIIQSENIFTFYIHLIIAANLENNEHLDDLLQWVKANPSKSVQLAFQNAFLFFYAGLN